MKNKILIKFIAILIIMITLFANVSFAANVDMTDLKVELEKFFSNDITLISTNDSRTKFTFKDMENEKFIITDSNIKCEVNIENRQYNFINYKLENNICTFDIDIDDFIAYFKASIPENEGTLEGYYGFLMYVGQFSILQNCYLAAAESVGQDLSLAYTYFQQEGNKSTNEDKIDINNGIYKYIVTIDKETTLLTQATLSVDLDNLKSLNSSMIDTSDYYYITTGEFSLSDCTISGISNKTYTGSTIKPNVTVKYKGIQLEEGQDYTISYSNNKNIGKATVTIKGKGDYFTGTIKKTFTISPKKISGFKVKDNKTNSVKLTWSKQTGITGYRIYSYNYSKNKWEYLGKISSKSNSCTIKNMEPGSIYKFRVRAYKNIDGERYYGSYSSSIKTATKTKTPSISKITTKSKKATVKWKKVSGASGYEVYMATSKNGKYSKIKTASKSTTSYTKTNLKKNKKYYFKIRSYKKVDGKKIYSSYSSIKSVKVK